MPKKQRNSSGRWAWILSLVAVLLVGPVASRLAASEIREKIAGHAREIARLLKDEMQNSVAVQEFTGPPTPSTSAGPLIQSTLIEELKVQKVTVNEDAFVFIKGDYFIMEDDRKSEELKVRLTITIRNKKGRRIDELNADIGFRGNDDLVKLLAPQGDLYDKPKADREDVNKKLKEDIKDPPVHIDGTKVQVRPTGPFAVEVKTGLPGSSQVALKPSIVKKLPFVDLQKGYVYTLVLHNNSKHEAAAVITIDGLDIFQFFQPTDQKPTSFIIPPGKSVTVPGWVFGQKDGQGQFKAFLVGSLADSPATKILKSSNSVGTITVCFHPSWEVGKPPPDYDGSRSADDKATVVGPEVSGKAERVKRTIGPLLQVISIRYKK